ncbi:MAG TPA: hypothetical protein VG935_04480, partial [Patescibacteria group bacterium]|nr:hypothetical protein [Patescibacteria group bacterium]
AVGGNITISESAKVPHNLTVAGGQVDISSAIGNDLNAAAGTVTIANSIGGNTTGLVGNLVLSPTATLHGNLTYTSHNQATIESGAQIMGKTTYHQTTPTEIRSEATAKKTASGILALFTWFKIVSLVSSLIVGFLVIKFVPVVVKTAGDTLLTRTWASLGLGIVTAVVVPIVLILLLITIVGIPLAFLSLAAYVIFLYMARLIVLIIIGQKLASYLSKDAGLIVGLVLGAVIYELISLIPVLNFLQFLLTYSLGLGALVMTKKSYYSTLRNKKLI